MIGKFVAVTFLLSTMLMVFPPDKTMAAEYHNSPILLTEVKIKNTSSTQTDEFIEIFNNGSSTLNLKDYYLEYFNISNPTESTVATKPTFALSDTELLPNTFAIFAVKPSVVTGSLQLPQITSLKDTEGLLRLKINDNLNPGQFIIVDELAWKDASTAEGVYDVPSLGTDSIQRFTNFDTVPVLFQPLWIYEIANPGAIVLIPPVPNVPDVEPNNEEPAEEPSEEPENIISCDGITITEILPNPSGADTSHEFIEIHNPTEDIIDLKGCTLNISGKSTVYNFPDELSLQPNEYLALYDSTTGITLPNAAGGMIILGSDSTDYIYDYPGNLKDDISWALINTDWAETDNLTPNAENELATPEEQEAPSGGITVLSPCPDGKFRNPATNRCKNIDSDDGLVPCKTGQYRSPDTNRCRNIITAGSSLTPCKPGQQRNPATNRCKSVLSANTLKPCKEGQERNPETNRCRNVVTLASASGSASGDQIKNQSLLNENKNKTGYIVAGTVGSLAVGYGAFEFRRDIINGLASLKSSLLAKIGK